MSRGGFTESVVALRRKIEEVGIGSQSRLDEGVVMNQRDSICPKSNLLE